jgi:hypothetical protein
LNFSIFSPPFNYIFVIVKLILAGTKNQVMESVETYSTVQKPFLLEADNWAIPSPQRLHGDSLKAITSLRSRQIFSKALS